MLQLCFSTVVLLHIHTYKSLHLGYQSVLNFKLVSKNKNFELHFTLLDVTTFCSRGQDV